MSHANDKRRFKEWAKDTPPLIPFNLTVDLTMYGDCHAKPDMDLYKSLEEVIRVARLEGWLAAAIRESSRGEG